MGFVAKTGMKFDAPLKLTDDGEVVFDFPEKPKPVETEVLCPQCGKKLMRTQWKLECECGGGLAKLYVQLVKQVKCLAAC